MPKNQQEKYNDKVFIKVKFFCYYIEICIAVLGLSRMYLVQRCSLVQAFCACKFSSVHLHYICVKLVVIFISVSMVFYGTCQMAKDISPKY